MYKFEDGILSRKKIIGLPCDHLNGIHLTSLMINRREQLTVSCEDCLDIKLLDLQTEEWIVAFSGIAGKLFDAGNDKLFVHTVNDSSVLQPNCSAPVFSGPIKILRPSKG